MKYAAFLALLAPPAAAHAGTVPHLPAGGALLGVALVLGGLALGAQLRQTPDRVLVRATVETRRGGLRK
ncbi:hypothetical protein GCM10011415_22350 [Salipiger pallidus]|uniref:Uncharacterized protein n=1 Tax=Salipiger pallidus TaxID=1775170 RepID=A0A8J2ZKI5_9RHOB|nr:hypothetical protein [Salipiger pallidus]GGG73567.1 hypothetical protein GCM10011415_22350 [Salipiger pallidus]